VECRLKPVDVTCSAWNCTLEREEQGSYSLRLGLRYVHGLRAIAAAQLEQARAVEPFSTIEELAHRVPSLSTAELTMLAEIGALNPLGTNLHRRDALWQVERAVRQAGPLFAGLDQDETFTSPLEKMNPTERIVADYGGTGVTVGWHPMAHCRSELRRMQVFPASHLRHVRNGTKARIAGCVIARQRPGTAHGFIFLSLEDETGICNAIIDPDLYEQNRSLVTYGKILLIEGMLQNIDKVVHIRMHRVAELTIDAQLALKSHDFH